MGYSSLSTRMRRRKNIYRRLTRRVIQLAIGLTFIILVVWGLYHWVHELWGRYGVEVEAVQAGVLQETVNLDALVINREELVYAPSEGKFFPALREGEKVRKGQHLGSMISSSLSSPEPTPAVVSPDNGLLRLRLDGMEGVITRESWQNLDLSELAASFPAPQNNQPDGWTAAGGVVAVILDNLIPSQLAVEIPTDSQTPEGLTEVWVRCEPEGDFQKARVVEQQPVQGKIRCLLELTEFREDLLLQRRVPVTLALKRWTGVVVPTGSLVEREGVQGIYVLRKGITEWIPVEVAGSSGGQSVIRGIESGELAVINPVWVEEGMRLR